jgi:dolichol-phosphate mannosyltransferase
MQFMRVLAAIPVFNEEKYVAGVIAEVRRYCSDVLVIDDGSTDATPDLLRKERGVAVIHHPENRGYGQSLIDAFAYGRRRGYDWVISIDCDDQHEPRQIPEFVDRAARDDVDVISGSRYLVELPGNTHAPADRRRINHTMTRVINEKLNLRLTDAFCGFKAHRVAALGRLKLTVAGYAFPIQFWVQAAWHRLRICELAVPLIYNDPTRHFGGILDDPRSRLAHYMEVFRAETARLCVPTARPWACGVALGCDI